MLHQSSAHLFPALLAVILGANFDANHSWLRAQQVFPPSGNKLWDYAFGGNESNDSYRIEYTSDWVAWIPLQTNQMAGSEVQVTDRGATNAARRYYRARRLP
jgi:hypothetical protein